MAVNTHDIDHAQTCPLADIKVVEIMRGRHLDSAGTSSRIWILIRNDRNTAADQRQNDILADERLVALIVRMNGNTGIAKHCFRTRRCDDQIVASFPFRRLAFFIKDNRMLIGCACFQRITQMPEMTLDLDLLDFNVGNRSQELRIPVDETLVLIDQALLEECDKHFQNGRGKPFVHGKPLT